MEDQKAGLSPDLDQILLHLPAELGKVLMGLHPPPDEVLIWGQDPMTQRSRIDALLLAEDTILCEPQFGLGPLSHACIVQADRALARPAVVAASLDVMVLIVGARRVETAAVPGGSLGPERPTVEPDGAFDVMARGHPGNEFAELAQRDVVRVVECIIERKVPDVGDDRMLELLGYPGFQLPHVHLAGVAQIHQFLDVHGQSTFPFLSTRNSHTFSPLLST